MKNKRQIFSLFFKIVLGVFINVQNLHTSSIFQEQKKWKHLEQTIIDRTFPMVASAIVDRVIFHPIETVITLQQSKKYGLSLPPNFINCSMEFYRREGVFAFYRGFTWTTLFAIPNKFMVFGSYFLMKEILNENDSASKFFFSGICAALVKSIISCPSEVIRTQRICQLKIPINNSYFYYLFRGFIPLNIKNITSLAPTLGGTDYILYCYPELRYHHFGGPFIVASMISFVFQFFATPADTLKTRMIENNTLRFQEHIHELWREKSILYRTFLPRALRSSFGAGINLGTFHLCMYILNK